MKTRLSSSSAPSWGQHGLQGSRKILCTQVRKDSAPVATSPPAPNDACQHSKTGLFLSCQQPPKLTIIFAGMGFMLFVVTIAVILLLLSFRRHRRQRPENSHGDTAGGVTCGSGDQPIYEGSGDCGGVVLVQLPGDDSPQIFARPAPFEDVSRSQEGTIGEGEKHSQG